MSFWTSVNCWSYHYSQTKMTWQQARTWCQEHHTDMVAIQNQEEITHLNSWLPKKSTYYWIGIRKINDVWTWVGTNKPLTEEAKNWALGEPNNANKDARRSEDCVEMYIKRQYQAGKWNDERCDKQKTALCYSAYCNYSKVNAFTCVCYLVAVRCPAISVLENAVVNCEGDTKTKYAYGNSCSFSCLPGYNLVGTKALTCTASAEWSGNVPYCQVIQCSKLSNPQWGFVRCSDPLGPSSYQSTCVFACEEGYELTGSQTDTLLCESTGQWNATQPSCTAVRCPAISVLENAVVNCEGDTKTKYAYGNSCSFSCLPGYNLVGTKALTCTASAEWSGNVPYCQGIVQQSFHCYTGKPNLIMNCSSNNSELAPGATCSFNCEPGFELHGAENLQCSEDVQWDEAVPTCEATLSQVTLIASGVAAGGAVSLSGLSLAMWILRKLKNRASKFDLSR
uniref:Uncharacterized protein n=1 Tax=Periophthalmus magnuspinnatus TaxID=409849 RepID=A0A3B4ASD8_9GOBI